MNFLIFFSCLLLFGLSEAQRRENHLSTLGNRISVLKGSASQYCPLTDLPLELITLITDVQKPLKTVFNKDEHEKRMLQMQAKDGDKRGHILSDALGGPAEIFNLAPQQFSKIKIELPNGKSRYTTQWDQIEKEIENYVGDGKGSVKYRVNLLYQDQTTPCRPSEFRVYADYYNRNGEIVKNVNSGPLMNNKDLEEGDPLLDNKPGPPGPPPSGPAPPKVGKKPPPGKKPKPPPSKAPKRSKSKTEA